MTDPWPYPLLPIPFFPSWRLPALLKIGHKPKVPKTFAANNNNSNNVLNCCHWLNTRHAPLAHTPFAHAPPSGHSTPFERGVVVFLLNSHAGDKNLATLLFFLQLFVMQYAVKVPKSESNNKASSKQDLYFLKNLVVFFLDFHWGSKQLCSLQLKNIPQNVGTPHDYFSYKIRSLVFQFD